MKMDITFAKPTTPNELEFTSDEKKYFYLLMEIPAFQIVVSETRKACNIPMDGMKSESGEFQSINHKRLFNIAILITNRLNLTWSWATTITALVLGLPLVKHQVSILPITSKADNRKVTITVNERMSRTELAKLIRKNTTLEDQLKTLPTNRPRVNRKSLSMDLSIHQIYNLVTTYSKTTGKSRKDMKLLEKIREKIDPADIIPQNMTYKDMDTHLARLNEYFAELFTHKDLLTHIVSNEPIERLLE